MININNFTKDLDILKFSRISSSFLVLAIFISIFAQTYLFYKIKDLNMKKATIDESYKALYEFKYQTEKLLSSYDLEKNRKEIDISFKTYKESFINFKDSFEVSHAILNYYEIINIKFENILKTLKRENIFSEKNMMNKPILVRFGELNRTEEKSDYFLLIKSFFESIDHLKQYQDFLLEDILEKKVQVYEKSNKDIDILNVLFISLPVIIIFIAVIFSIIVDQSIRKKEIVLTNTKKLLENIMNSIPIRIFWKDKNGVYIGANDLFVKDCRLGSKEELLGKTDFELPWKNSEAKEYTQDDKAVIQSKKPKLNILETQTREDGISYLNTSKVPLFDEHENVIGIIGIYEDVTDRVKDQEKIKAQEMQIVQQNRQAQMGEMIAMIAHQWRQPLTVISTVVGTLQLKTDRENFDKDDFSEKFRRIIIQTKYLSDTIDDFRNFFKPDKEKSKIKSIDLITKTLTIVESTLKTNNIKVITDFSCENELYIYRNEVKQVLLNIIKNSIDAFWENRIKDRYIKIESKCAKGSKCTITIEDNAGGIPEGIIQKIFDPYFSTKEKNGTGLGLYMSRMIIEEHCDGELSVSSKEGKTVFKIII